MGAYQYEMWRSYYHAEPFGQPWENWLMALPAAQFAQANSKKGTMIKMQDYFYECKEDKEDREIERVMTFFEGKKNG